jgi:hypothetical protein
MFSLSQHQTDIAPKRMEASASARINAIDEMMTCATLDWNTRLYGLALGISDIDRVFVKFFLPPSFRIITPSFLALRLYYMWQSFYGT